MTGLDPQTDHIIQVSCFVTDADLNILDPNGFSVTVHQPESILSAMNAWCIETHGRTGLTAAVRESTITPTQAAASLLAYIQRYVPIPRTALLAGNSVHADKAFLLKDPYSSVLEWLHYRILDVSCFKEGVRRWAGEKVLTEAPVKKGVHLARDDILESIEEMKYYRKVLFGNQG